jgi:hypothetical protein
MSSEEIVKEVNLSAALNGYDEYFHTKKYVFNNNEYTIIKYDKKKLKVMENSGEPYFNVLSKFRSLVVRNNKLIVFSPEKSLNFETFNKKYENIDECWTEDFIDGTMITVFYDNINNTWEIATRSTVGGNIVFFNDIKNYSFFNCDNQFEHYNNITFRSMFFESCNANNFDLNSLNTNYCYSFVMQHPFNRIVTPVQTPFIYLVKVYEIDNTSFPIVYVKEKNLSELVNKPPYIFANTNVQFVNKYLLETSLNELKTHYDNKLASFQCVGTIVYNKDGTRTKIRNVNYEEVRKLRGNQPKLQYNYLSLKKENKIKEFLYYYPEHVLLFNKFKLLMFEYTNELFSNYISCFIKKHKHLKEYPFQYKNHMYHIHQKYISDLKPNAKVVDKKVVIDYVNDLHPAQQMFVINYKYNPTSENSVENSVENNETMECNE